MLFYFSVTVTEVLWLLTEAYREEEKHSCRRPKRQRTGVVEQDPLSIVQVAKQCAEEKQCHGKETGVIHGAIVPVEAVTLKFHCLNTQKAENGRNGDPFSASSRQKTAEQRTQQIKNTSAQ